jgi:hypothetical protein
MEQIDDLFLKELPKEDIEIIKKCLQKFSVPEYEPPLPCTMGSPLSQLECVQDDIFRGV